MKRRRTCLLIVIACVALSTAAFAQQDLKPLVKQGERAIDAGNYQEALDYFQQVVQQLQNLVGAAFESFMPKALSGWEAGELNRQSWAGTSEEYTGNTTNITQTFTRKSDGKTIQINLTNWPHLLQGLKQSADAYKQMSSMMANNPEMTLTFEERGDWTVMRVVENERGRTTLNAFSESAMISIEADYPDAKEADDYLSAIDLAGVNKQAQRKPE